MGLSSGLDLEIHACSLHFLTVVYNFCGSAQSRRRGLMDQGPQNRRRKLSLQCDLRLDQDELVP